MKASKEPFWMWAWFCVIVSLSCVGYRSIDAVKIAKILLEAVFCLVWRSSSL